MRVKKTAVFVVSSALILFAAIFAVFYFSRLSGDTPAVTLPPPPAAETDAPAITHSLGDNGIEVNPDTVQAVIATLVRPDSYSRTLTIERFWSGGSSAHSIGVWVSPSATRLDITSDSGLQSIILTAEKIYTWYDGRGPYYEGALADEPENGSDIWQQIATYEDVLSLGKDEITDAGYIQYGGVYCIYVEAISRELRYTERYYIDLDLGLLIAAETYDGGQLVYRMGSGDTDSSAPAEDKFTLPDGTVVY